MESAAARYGTKRSYSQAFPEKWTSRHSKSLPDQQEQELEQEIKELEARWDIIDNKSEKIYESIGSVYDTLRRRIREFPVQDDEIAVNMSYREGISMARELYNDAEKVMEAAKTAQTEAKYYEDLLLDKYAEYIEIRDIWLDRMKKLAEVTDAADAIIGFQKEH